MYYSEDDMIKQIPAVNNATLFERHACKAMAFGDNLALSATFVGLANGLNLVDEKMSEVNDNKDVLSQETNALAVALMQTLSPVLQEV